jgi:chromate transporter
LAAQLAMYLGYVRAGIFGATMVSLAFILPSFLMVLARRAVVDVPTALIALATLLVLVKVKKVPEPLIILVAGILGLVLFRGVH